jgi:hypothetical protein
VRLPRPPVSQRRFSCGQDWHALNLYPLQASVPSARSVLRRRRLATRIRHDDRMHAEGVGQHGIHHDDRIYAEGVRQHSPGSRERTLGWHASFTSPNPNGVLQTSGRRHGIRIPNTETIIQPRGRAGVEPRWGSGWVGWMGPRSQGALSRPWVGMRHPRSPNPNGVLQTSGWRHGIQIPNTETTLESRGRADVEPRWGSNMGGLGGSCSQGAIATLGFDVKPLRGKLDDQGRCNTNKEPT